LAPFLTRSAALSFDHVNLCVGEIFDDLNSLTFISGGQAAQSVGEHNFVLSSLFFED
jgi:hypothetical protein